MADMIKSGDIAIPLLYKGSYITTENYTMNIIFRW